MCYTIRLLNLEKKILYLLIFIDIGIKMLYNVAPMRGVGLGNVDF